MKNVKTEGVKFGTVTGMAPAAKIAAYKVLWAQEDGTASGLTSDIVAAIDDAVADGADVLNFSISGATDTVVDLTEYVFEGAAEAGVFIAASAGNSGPDASTVAHNSPWLTTVAASTHYNFENTLVLGNGKKIVGASISKSAVPDTKLVDSAELPPRAVTRTRPPCAAPTRSTRPRWRAPSSSAPVVCTTASPRARGRPCRWVRPWSSPTRA